MKVQIICRGSIQEGLGHLFRTRTFAKTAQYMHETEIIAIVQENLESILSELVCPIRFVRNDAEVIMYVQQGNADILIFDLTKISKRVFQYIKYIPHLTASLSPVFEHMEHIDALFTRVQNPSPIEGVRIYGGLQYAIFNDQGVIIDDIIYERNLKRPELPIAVCMGGADAANKTLAVVQALVQSTYPFTLWVLLGEGYIHSYNALVDAVNSNRSHEVVLAKTNRSMWQIMSNCTLGILAGGLTTIEALYAGLPTINILQKREHFDVMHELFDMGVCLYGGNFSSDALNTLVKTVEYLSKNREQLQNLRKKSHGLIDTRGSERVIVELERLLRNKLTKKQNIR
jgi:spore coat polysaccharide biosynthesis predicted glycosyltransferase SpsG